MDQLPESLKNYAEIIGNTAGIIVLISLLMRSLIKLRWINLFGSLVFALYGILVGAPAIVLTNLGIAFIDLWYLYKMYTEIADFKLVTAEKESGYFKHFLDTNQEDIKRLFGEPDIETSDHSYYMLRGNQVAGILVGRQSGDTFHIIVDYVTPEYRDFKLGRHFFEENPRFFQDRGINHLTTYVFSDEFKR